MSISVPTIHDNIPDTDSSKRPTDDTNTSIIITTLGLYNALLFYVLYVTFVCVLHNIPNQCVLFTVHGTECEKHIVLKQ